MVGRAYVTYDSSLRWRFRRFSTPRSFVRALSARRLRNRIVTVCLLVIYQARPLSPYCDSLTWTLCNTDSNYSFPLEKNLLAIFQQTLVAFIFSIVNGKHTSMIFFTYNWGHFFGECTIRYTAALCKKWTRADWKHETRLFVCSWGGQRVYLLMYVGGIPDDSNIGAIIDCEWIMLCVTLWVW